MGNYSNKLDLQEYEINIYNKNSWIDVIAQPTEDEDFNEINEALKPLDDAIENLGDDDSIINFAMLEIEAYYGSEPRELQYISKPIDGGALYSIIIAKTY